MASSFLWATSFSSDDFYLFFLPLLWSGYCTPSSFYFPIKVIASFITWDSFFVCSFLWFSISSSCGTRPFSSYTISLGEKEDQVLENSDTRWQSFKLLRRLVIILCVILSYFIILLLANHICCLCIGTCYRCSHCGLRSWLGTSFSGSDRTSHRSSNVTWPYLGCPLSTASIGLGWSEGTYCRIWEAIIESGLIHVIRSKVINIYTA